jgi:hypothetical protein
MTSIMDVRMQKGFNAAQESRYKSANVLASDAITNYRTVASLANEEKIVEDYSENLKEPMEKACK